MFDLEVLKSDLKRDEGVRRKPYLCTAGKVTIGVGRNLDDMGITECEADYLLENDIGRILKELDQNIAWWRDLSEGRQRALINMAFNMGISRLLKFKKTLFALQNGGYDIAAAEALDSQWARQVHERACRIARLIVEG